MQLDIYKNKLAAFDITAIIPDEDEIETMNSYLYRNGERGLFTRHQTKIPHNHQ
jgi:aspartate/glutamate racemase